ncbi:MAG: hypothetical protein E7446_05710 [Ruminococcaceae bacterium]|nr:hypothetical protein [Oscillospiraceae bacterium]
MKKLRQMTPKKALFLYGVCAVIWTVIVVMDVVNGAYKEDMVMFALKAICIPAWIVVFFTTLKRYRNGEYDEKE